VSRGHPDGSLAAKAHPSGSLSSSAHPDGTLTSKAHPAGTLVTRTHPPKAGGAVAGDAFQSVVEGSTAGGTSLACWWSPNGEAAGNLTTGDVAMVVMNSIANPAIKVRVKDATDWKIVADNIGSETSLTSAIEANEQRRVESPYEDNFCGIDNSVSLDSDLDEVLGGDDGVLSSGFVFFKPAVNASSIYQDILVFEGTDASGQTSHFSSNTNFAIRYVQSSSKPAITFGHIGAFDKIVILEDTFTSDLWWYIAWRQTDRDGTNSDFSIYAVKVDGSDDWSDAVTDTADFSVGYGTGLTFGHESSHNADDQDGWRWGPIGLFKGDIGIGTSGTTLRTIFEAIE